MKEFIFRPDVPDSRLKRHALAHPKRNLPFAFCDPLSAASPSIPAKWASKVVVQSQQEKRSLRAPRPASALKYISGSFAEHQVSCPVGKPSSAFDPRQVVLQKAEETLFGPHHVNSHVENAAGRAAASNIAAPLSAVEASTIDVGGNQFLIGAGVQALLAAANCLAGSLRTLASVVPTTHRREEQAGDISEDDREDILATVSPIPTPKRHHQRPQTALVMRPVSSFNKPNNRPISATVNRRPLDAVSSRAFLRPASAGVARKAVEHYVAAAEWADCREIAENTSYLHPRHLGEFVLKKPCSSHFGAGFVLRSRNH